MIGVLSPIFSQYYANYIFNPTLQLLKSCVVRMPLQLAYQAKRREKETRMIIIMKNKINVINNKYIRQIKRYAITTSVTR